MSESTEVDRLAVTDAVLKTVDLTRSFDSIQAVDHVDFALERGELQGLIGPNGAGKTTFMRLLSGILEPDDGSIILDGEDITTLPSYERTRHGLAQSLQIESIFPSLTVRENVLGAINARDGPLSPVARYDSDGEATERTMEILASVGLDDLADEPATELSYGDQKLLEIALALGTDPDVLLLDEPTAGLSADETRVIEDLVAALAGDISIILIEHDVDLVLRLTDSITVLHNGQVIAEGSPEDVSENERVQEVYMGR
jgi:branched-chain amino acid transport system ATP-binding protein